MALVSISNHLLKLGNLRFFDSPLRRLLRGPLYCPCSLRLIFLQELVELDKRLPQFSILCSIVCFDTINNEA